MWIYLDFYFWIFYPYVVIQAFWEYGGIVHIYSEKRSIVMAPKKGGKMEAFPTNWLHLSKVYCKSALGETVNRVQQGPRFVKSSQEGRGLRGVGPKIGKSHGEFFSVG